MSELGMTFGALTLGLAAKMYYDGKYAGVEYVKSKVDNKKYLVRKMPDKQHAADLLANLRIKLVKLCDYLELKHSDSKKVYRLIKRFNSDNITESSPTEKYTSYSVNKGEKIVFCLRSRDEQHKLVNENIMMFVALHELAHIMTKSVGHTDEFWDNFRYLLKKAIKLGVYKDVNFEKNPVDYCGTKITNSPL
jgi:predicted metal-dependent hydrolase